MAMVEPLPYHRDASGRLALRKDTASLARAVTVASALGTTSAWTWLKMPSCDEPEVVYGATTLPCVVLGGVAGARPRRPTSPRGGGPWDRTSCAAWSSAARCSTRPTATSPGPSTRRPTSSPGRTAAATAAATAGDTATDGATGGAR